VRRPAADLAGCGLPVEQRTRVEIQDATGCPRYTARVLTGVRIGPSPLWMQQRLARAGVRPINNVVDITNYVMLECGQPLHAFDQGLLHEGRIVVRRAQPGERMATLDGVERSITSAMLMICDADRPVAVAGVMGGAGSEIRDTTDTVLLESACFKPSDIRRTSKALALSTESSYRFERGVDLEQVDWASRRAAALMVAHAGAAAAPGVVDVYPGVPSPVRIGLRHDRARSLLGTPVTDAEIERILAALDLPVVERKAGACTVAVPTFRPDLTEEADLIEEVARIHGLDRVPAPSPAARLVPEADDQPVRALTEFRSRLVGLGLQEVMNYSFLAERQLDLVGYGDPARRVRIPNPVTQDHALLRDSLVPQMIETLGRNRARQVDTCALFELGRVFFQRADGRYAEEERVCIGLTGVAGRHGLAATAAATPDETFAWIKGLLEQVELAAHLRERDAPATRSSRLALQPAALGFLDPDRGVTVSLDGRECGVLGLVCNRLRDEWRLAAPAAVLELKVAPLLPGVFRIPSSRPVAQYPGVGRDVALIVPRGVRHEQVAACIWNAAPPELADVRLFDVYEGKGIPEGCRSLAYSLFYRSAERTLTDAEANGFRDQAREALKRELGAEIREG
jgi:phenylalanyl-tRNA synthetase beta chain